VQIKRQGRRCGEGGGKERLNDGERGIPGLVWGARGPDQEQMRKTPEKKKKEAASLEKGKKKKAET